MAKRKTMGKKIRFEVFKRDKFTCQYCGTKAPDAVLVVDHIHPVAAGGDDDMLNLTTACVGCNSGKSDRKLDDASEVERQRRQLEELQERRDQLDMMLEWKKGLLDLDDHALRQVSETWSRLVQGYRLNERGEQELRKLIRRYGAGEVLGAIKIAVDSYLRFTGTPPKPEGDSVETAWLKVGGILRVAQEEKTKPYLHDLYKIRAAVRNNKSGSYREWELTALLTSAFESGATTAEMWRIVYDTSTVWQFERAVLAYIDSLGESDA